ncbi:hypothetical protein EDD22DRAFT_898118 [Suillus occidentalis]|nr:hypothetical protein EDD22DRAFT_898118 [Suillus occidentalis]
MAPLPVVYPSHFPPFPSCILVFYTIRYHFFSYRSFFCSLYFFPSLTFSLCCCCFFSIPLPLYSILCLDLYVLCDFLSSKLSLSSSI